MAEYVEKSIIFPALNKAMSENGALGMADVEDIIDDLPTADVQPVKRGRWEKDEKGQFHHCSECKAETFRDVDSWGLDYGEFLSEFCPCCGAYMREADATKG